MSGGFSFCGVDIGKIGLEYAPELADIYVYKATKSRIFEETFDSHPGGYYYGEEKEPKEFYLKCIFQEKEVDRGLMSKIYHLFKTGRTGKLVFDRRPWCEYTATVMDLDDSGLTNYMNGIIIISMKAYYPFGTCNMLWVPPRYKDFNRVFENTALFEKEEMVPQTSFATPDNPLTQAKQIILTNPGNEKAPVGIEIAGNVGFGITITNLTTQQSCRFVAMDDNTFDGVNSYLFLDSMSGKTMAISDGKAELSFIHHDRGYMHLSPGYPCVRNMFIYTAEDENNHVIVYSKNKLYDHRIGETREDAIEEYVGKYIWLDNDWRKIVDIGNGITPTFYEGNDEHILILDQEVSAGIRVRTSIYHMDEILINPDPGAEINLTRLNFVFKPTFS